MEKQIGWFNLRKEKVFTNQYETAAWYENVKVPAGRYPISVYDYRVLHFDDERRKEYNGRVDGHIGGAYIYMTGTITSDNFQSLFYGMPIGKPYDGAQNAGKPSHHNMFTYLYEIADSVLNNPENPYELFPEYEAREINFVYDGKPCTTHSIYLKEG